jgi:multidrug resistance efflux pump
LASRLKTYTAELDGLNDWIVAAPNQKAALTAFGVHQDLFAQGQAGVTTDSALVEAAAASPGQPLKRPKGGKGPFKAGPADSDWAKALEAAGKGAKPPKKVSRAKLDKAESALEAAERAGEAELARLESEASAARERLAAAQERHDAEVETARAAVEAARTAYRKASE